ncbi:MAG: PilZ domain-containing protein [Candidatus Acidiferrales bacterium]
MVEVYRKGDFQKPDRRKPNRDRRVHPRYIFFADCELTDRSTDSHYEVRVTEISAGGGFVDLIVAIPPETEVHLRVRSEDRIFQAEGRVAYHPPSMGHGITFVRSSPDSQQILDGWIQSLTR